MINDELQSKLAALTQAAEPFLEEGKTYYRVDFNSLHGSSSRGYYTIENADFQHFNPNGFTRAARTSPLNQHFPAWAAVRYTLRKGMPARVEHCTAEQLLELFPIGLKHWVGYARVEAHIKFLDNGKMDIDEKRYATENDRQIDADNSLLDDELLAFYHATGKQIKRAYLYLSHTDFVLQTQPAIQGLTSEMVEKKVELSLDVNDLNAVYDFLESCDEAKVANAIAALEQHPDHKAKAEKRYLNWIRTRLKKPNASLQDFVAANPPKALINKMLSRNIAKDFISLSYFDDDESTFVVDFIGSMVKNYLDIDAFVGDATAVSNEQELRDCYLRYAQPAKAAILAQANDYPDGWLSKAIKLVFGLPIRRLLFEKTQFDIANTSPVLREFMFYWNMTSEIAPHFDIFQSDEPALTDIFWLLPNIPTTGWGDTTPRFSDSPLSFSRSAQYKVGDSGKWKIIQKP